MYALYEGGIVQTGDFGVDVTRGISGVTNGGDYNTVLRIGRLRQQSL